MSLLSCPAPTNINRLYGTGNYQFSLVKFPEITFMVKSVELPGISLGTITQATSVHDVPMPGETMTFDDLQTTFYVDDKMSNYYAINEWMIGLGYPKNHSMYRDLMKNSKNSASLTELSKGFTDGVLQVLGNDNLPIMQMLFVDCFPTRLTGVQFDSSNADSDPLSATATFAYSYYTMILPT
jgi:hypothetical protein